MADAGKLGPTSRDRTVAVGRPTRMQLGPGALSPAGPLNRSSQPFLSIPHQNNLSATTSFERGTLPNRTFVASRTNVLADRAGID